jgi:hypothetical protein
MLHRRSWSPRDLVTVETTGSSPVCGAMRVQLDGRAAGFEPVGWEFESLYPRYLAVVKRKSHDSAKVGLQVQFLAARPVPMMLVR